MYIRISTSFLHLASRAIDVKARKRIEELYELTDEIINAYNEVNETYVSKIYRKYKQLQDINRNLKKQLSQHHCAGCKCTTNLIQNEGENDNSAMDEENQRCSQSRKTSSSSKNSSIATRNRKRNRQFLFFHYLNLFKTCF